MALLAAYAHVFMQDETAALIGWKGGSPFQYEIGMANLSYGILGVLAFWQRGKFWEATIIGWNVLFLGCMVGHILDYYRDHNDAPYNIGPESGWAMSCSFACSVNAHLPKKKCCKII